VSFELAEIGAEMLPALLEGELVHFREFGYGLDLVLDGLADRLAAES
jgi:hypothetical protein